MKGKESGPVAAAIGLDHPCLLLLR